MTERHATPPSVSGLPDLHDLTPAEIAALPLWARCCYFIHSFNAGGRAEFKCIDDWASRFGYQSADHALGLAQEAQRLMAFVTSFAQSERTAIVWHSPDRAEELLRSELDESACADGCVVKLDVTHERHDGGPYLRQATYDNAIGCFVCSATATALPNVKAWAYDAEEA